MIRLYKHQEKAVEILSSRGRFAFFAEMGTGKTISTLATINELGGKTLVLCPKSVMDTAWVRDAQHFPRLRAKVLRAFAKPVREQVIASKDWDVLVTNYEMFRSCFDMLKAAGIRRLVVDESSKCKSHETETTKKAQQFADLCDSAWILSGTPAPNCPTEYIPQMRVVSREVFGPSYWSAVNRYFVPVRKNIRVGRTTRQIIDRYHQTPEQRASFEARLKQWSWTLSAAECIDLPDKTEKIVAVDLDDEEEAYFMAETDLKILAGGEASPIKREAALMKLRQIVGGSVLVEGHLHEIGDSKLKALGEVLDEIGHEPCVIWAEFKGEIARIEAMIRKRGESVARIDGETSHVAGATAADFQAGKIKRLICHPQSAGHGITLTAARYAVYYSLSFSLEQHEQSRARIHRIGQHRPCVYVYLLGELKGEETVDHAMKRVLEKKADKAGSLSKLLRRPWKDEVTVESDIPA